MIHSHLCAYIALHALNILQLMNLVFSDIALQKLEVYTNAARSLQENVTFMDNDIEYGIKTLRYSVLFDSF